MRLGGIRPSLRASIAVAALSVGACGPTVDAPEPASAALPPPVAIEGTQSKAERTAFTKLFKETSEVLTSPEFQKNLRSLGTQYPTVFMRRAVQTADVLRLARTVAAQSGGVHYVPMRLTLVGGPADPIETDRHEASTGQEGLFDESASVWIGRAVLDRYRSENLVERSCAINAMAHELSHTISITPVLFTMAITDTTRVDKGIVGRQDEHTAVASYLIGSVAQCTYLQIKGRVPAWAVPDCIRVFGTRAFNGLRCTKFNAEQPVELRADLPEANLPL